ncbi:hypothetical protein [Amorphus sp. MBR-141]
METIHKTIAEAAAAAHEEASSSFALQLHRPNDPQSDWPRAVAWVRFPRLGISMTIAAPAAERV